MTETVGALGESRVLRRILERLGHASGALVGPGDDCAVLRGGGDLVVTTDTMIEGPDFRLAWHSGFELGWKLAATNLSDVASMGAVPTALTLALACPRETPVELLEQLASGMAAACRALAPECGVVGGDLATAPVLTAAVTAIGELRGATPVLRSGATAGDIVAYAGDLGLAGTGLALLFREGADDTGVAHSEALAGLWSEHPEAMAAQLAPTPPVTLGPPAAHAGATAMLDVSDSLSLDAARIARASGVDLAFESGLLRAGFGEREGEAVSLDAMLTGGEDHGLLATFPARSALPDGFVRIGEVRARADDEPRVLVDGEEFVPGGWDPYRISLPGL